MFFFSAIAVVDCLKSEREVGKLAVRRNAGGNDTVPILVWRGRCMPVLSAIVLVGCLSSSLY